MGNHKSSTAVVRKSTSNVDATQQVACRVEVSLYVPLSYKGGTLGFADGNTYTPAISIVDSHGQRFYTGSVEWVLHHIDLFHEGCQVSLLRSVAVHYGFEDVNALVKGRMQ